ncbi:MarR family transcriptional regulator [Streptomyces sp. NBC_01387]|uniref:MarR family winged helix-turn-helix transcriptional regulator n=1 Tax=unclassified Streptomyces TaxID=2593676 RepID=UPI00225BD454|nr:MULTISPECIES: MarR family transcriptional regulator [unclassified Streptomyces]MCX4548477.1 MarR family transcriptional regulator [Streptomyces sp. NBC_01500]WSC20094.1 MarR family transcriptional regulator [Streptomyces sp. NBC_01766]WSV54115.1 MarR family transcriptional regulator [Streptomyces sp. NBC_01014]
MVANPAEPGSEQIAAELAAVLGRVARRLRQASPGLELTHSQRSALALLEREGPTTTAALARIELVRPQSMRLTVGALEQRGFVARAPDPTDGRQSVMSVTDLGRRTLAAVRADKQGWLARAIDEELDGAERRTLVEAAALLERLAQR